MVNKEKKKEQVTIKPAYCYVYCEAFVSRPCNSNKF